MEKCEGKKVIMGSNSEVKITEEILVGNQRGR